jgi:uncharacterized protein
MHPAFSQIDHRPWPLPAGVWGIAQNWMDLAFIHYAVEAEVLRRMLPRGVELELFGGNAWVGVVPFEMVGVTHRWVYGVASMPRFPEVNVRTYVTDGKRPGVWFLSLDADSAAAVMVGRRRYGLPYHSARMAMTRKEGWIGFASHRRSGPGELEARYRPVGPVFYPKPGTFEHWAMERYCLYNLDPAGGLVRVQIHHKAWPVQEGRLEMSRCTLLEAVGLGTPSEGPVCHFSSGVEAVTYGIERVG